MDTDISVSREEILQKLHAIAMHDATDVVAVQDGQLEICATDTLPPDTKAAIASIEMSAGKVKVKFYDKLKALELLGKHMGLFEPQLMPKKTENDLLAAIRESTREVIDVHDIPEIQQAAASGDDLVEPAGS